jgi:hypothetical protein
VNLLIGFLFLLVAIWQFFITYRGFKKMRTEKDAGNSSFVAFGFFFSLIFGGMMLVLAFRIFTESYNF